MGWWFWLPPWGLDGRLFVVATIAALLVMLTVFDVIAAPLARVGEWLAERSLEKFIRTMQEAMYGCPECGHARHEHFIYQPGCMKPSCHCIRSQPWLEERGFY